jgi:glutamate 5-kinase
MKLVIKLGTSALTDKNGFLNKKFIFDFTSSIKELMNDGHQIIIVSSGAIGAALGKLNIKTKPKTLRVKQALAAIGQPIIMSAYCESFAKHDVNVAQILLTRDDFEDRTKFINVRNTLSELLDRNIISIINENDTVAVEEINFGDNDTLAALVSTAIDADIFIILTDVDGFYAGLPSKSNLIKRVEKITPEIEALASPHSSSGKGSGGMMTKVIAAKIATSSGIDTMIINRLKHNLLKEIIISKNHGTHFVAKKIYLEAKKSWIAFGKKTKGTIFVDKAAQEAITNKGKSLLAAGIKEVVGNFKRGDAVTIAQIETAIKFAQGLSNFDTQTIEKIKGKKTTEIAKLISPTQESEVIHRDNLAIF